MTLIPCSDKIFRPWDTDARKDSPTPVLKEEHERLTSSPAASSSSASSSDESELSRISIGAESPSSDFSAVHPAYPHHLMFGHQFPFAPLPAWMSLGPRVHFPQPMHQQPFDAVAPSMERFLASLEAAPEALHPSRLAALGMGPSDIGELYQLAGLKPIHPFPSVGAASSAPSGKKQRPKRFRCPHCNVAFSNNGQLKGHVRSHTGSVHHVPVRQNIDN